ncbi:RDD family protein [Phytomonospora sp. NPDC050363]|uniref:RDD family protein n=1 Tax=Phytomonospora sp. NPDC050363 TaxID=3155642 RepID=UPI0033C79D81
MTGDGPVVGWTPPDRPGDLPPYFPQPGRGDYPAQHTVPPGAFPHRYLGHPPPRSGPALAEIWQRILAYVIDQAVFSTVGSVVLLPVWLLGFASIGLPAPRPGERPRPGETVRPGELADFPVEFVVLYGVSVVVILLLLLTYQSVCVAKWGATIGKKAMKLRVVRAADGGRVSWGQAIGRAASTAGLALIPCAGWLNQAWCLWDRPNRQALHDKLASTVVVRVDHAPFGPRAEFTG